jgi:hypothetical protein
MNALQPPRLPSPPSRRVAAKSMRRSSRRSSRRTVRSSTHRAAAHRTIALEVSARLGVNLLLGLVAVSALVKLLPYNLMQAAKLKELQTEVTEVEGRVDLLRAEFKRNFDPQQALNVMQEQSARMHPNQRQIIWLTPTDSIAEEPEEEVRRDRQQTWNARD